MSKFERFARAQYNIKCAPRVSDLLAKLTRITGAFSIRSFAMLLKIERRKPVKAIDVIESDNCLGRRPSGIYRIVYKVNERSYVGQSSDIYQRWTQHKNLLVRGAHHRGDLQRDWTKHGPEHFVFEFLEPVSKKIWLVHREEFWAYSLWLAGERLYIANAALKRFPQYKANKEVMIRHLTPYGEWPPREPYG